MKNETTILEATITHEPLSAFIQYPQKNPANTFSDMCESRPQNVLPTGFCIVHQLQMLEPISAVFVTEAPKRERPINPLVIIEHSATVNVN